jgi:perosamine synthetase
MRICQVQPWLGEAEREGILDSLDQGWISEGPKSEAFVERLNARVGVPYGVLAPNGTLALALGLMALGIGRDDEVLVPDLTFVGSATAVHMVGAVPVIVEVNPVNFQIDTQSAARMLTSRTRAVMPVHLYGMTADMDAVMAFARQHGLKVIEDAAQAIGVQYRGRHAGSFGDVGCFSFFADKTLTIGEGGYVATSDPAIYENLRLLRNQGRIDRGSFVHGAIGYNFRITDLQAAIGLAQIERLDEVIDRKLRLLDRYRVLLEGIPQVAMMPVEEGSTHVPFRLVLLCEDMPGLRVHLEAHGVQTRGVFCPMHRQPALAFLDRRSGGTQDFDDRHFPNAIRAYEQGLCLPLFPTMSQEQVAHVCDGIRSFYAG